MWAHLLPVRLQAIMNLLLMFKLGKTLPLKCFQRTLGLMAAAAPVCQLGLLHTRPLQLWLKDCPVSCLIHGHTVHPSNSQMPGCNCDSPLEKHNYVQTGRVNRTSVQMQNCHNKCIKCWAGEPFVMTHQLSVSDWTQREHTTKTVQKWEQFN